MQIDVLIEDHRWDALDVATLADKACRASLQHVLGDTEAEVSVLACNDRRIADLNEDFRGKPTPTNVLSWPSQERGADADGGTPNLVLGLDAELGDIAIAYDTCLREADAAGRSLADQTMHLLVHGTLHLLGFDHERDGDAQLMERIEVEILGNLGVADPYEQSDA